jgi:pimeloyl-ACP methyl ester carboxylesterase
MPEAQVNGVRLHHELHGSGEPLALVHGAWADATAWRFVVPGLAENFRVLSYDRRGHSRSERPATQGSFDEDGDDLTALLEALDLAPAHVVTNSGGGNIALRLATKASGPVPLTLVPRAGALGAARAGPGQPADPAAGHSQRRVRRQADRPGRPRGRRAAVRRRGRLRSRRVGARATARVESDLPTQRSHLPRRHPEPEPDQHRPASDLTP